ncbi:MAG: metallophosphoesterase [Kiritimatiellae bacterium]|nr:metallophosphoesterase [Kiritimatiellia bacterium]
MNSSSLSKLLRFGVASDPHITNWASAATFRKALRWFRDQGIDALMIPGDLTDHGIIPQLENVAQSWREVFPDDRLPDGRHVEKLFIYGNHDFEGLAYRDKWMDAAFDLNGISREEADGLQLKNVGLDKAWEKCFGEPYEPIWHKRVKGYDFIGGHSAWNAPAGLAEWFEKNASSLSTDKPFFYFQHPHLKDTVYGQDAPGCDDGTSTRVLSAFPNAIAISGHSHISVADDSAIWRGAFTSIAAASMSYCYWPDSQEKTERSRAAAIGLEGGVPFAQGLLVDVFADSISIRRRDFVLDEEIGEPWTLPLS